MDACEEMSCFGLDLGSDEETSEQYRRNVAKGKNFIYIDEEKYFKDLEKEYGEAVSAAFPTVETSSTRKERLSKKKSGELLPLEELVHIAKKQEQEQEQQVIASKTSRRRKSWRRKSSSS